MDRPNQLEYHRPHNDQVQDDDTSIEGTICYKDKGEDVHSAACTQPHWQECFCGALVQVRKPNDRHRDAHAHGDAGWAPVYFNGLPSLLPPIGRKDTNCYACPSLVVHGRAFRLHGCRCLVQQRCEREVAGDCCLGPDTLVVCTVSGTGTQRARCVHCIDGAGKQRARCGHCIEGAGEQRTRSVHCIEGTGEQRARCVHCVTVSKGLVSNALDVCTVSTTVVLLVLGFVCVLVACTGLLYLLCLLEVLWWWWWW